MFVPYQYGTAVQAGILALGLIASAGFAIESLRDRRARLSVNRLLAWAGGLTFVALLGYQAQILARQAKEHADFVTCSTHLKRLGLAMGEYLQDTGHYPPADHWDTALAKYLPHNDIDSIFQCPDSSSKFGYAYNRALSNLPLVEVSAPSETVAVFECNSSTRNASGGRWNLVIDRHTGRPLYLFGDGSVRSVNHLCRDPYMTWKPKDDKKLPQ